MTRHQKIALLDILLAYARMPEQTQLFVDAATGAKTSTGELLTLITEEIVHTAKGRAAA